MRVRAWLMGLVAVACAVLVRGSTPAVAGAAPSAGTSGIPGPSCPVEVHAQNRIGRDGDHRAHRPHHVVVCRLPPRGRPRPGPAGDCRLVDATNHVATTRAVGWAQPRTDASAQPGHRYAHVVTALDRTGNESPPAQAEVHPS
ncbi:hypothetical protein [Lapillicoccus sp.]|uniref:hypothetical protein n=1 Tax=Lapillicoccus sp. TaxID=1909287 RepID=UPI0025F605ED|nr:hypothetical protein [Lapillicoccus sp.]